MCSFYRPPPLTSYHHLLDPASAAATRPLLLAAGLYGANSLALPPPIPPSVHAPPAVASILPTTSNEDRRASSCGGTTTVPTGGPLDLSHLASNHHHQSHHHHLHVPGLVDNCNGAVGGGTGSVGKLPSAASMHSFLQLHKSAGKNGYSKKFLPYYILLLFLFSDNIVYYRRNFFEDPYFLNFPCNATFLYILVLILTYTKGQIM